MINKLREMDLNEEVINMKVNNIYVWEIIRANIINKYHSPLITNRSIANILQLLFLNLLMIVGVIIKKIINFRSMKLNKICIVSPDRLDHLGFDRYLLLKTINLNQCVIIARPVTKSISIFSLFKFINNYNIVNTLHLSYMKFKLYEILVKLNLNYFNIVDSNQINSVLKICKKYNLKFDKNELIKFFIFKLYFENNLKGIVKAYSYCGYNITNFALNAACRISLDINSIEVQHGLYFPNGGSYHSFNNKVDYKNTFLYANEFYAFDELSKKYLLRSNSYLQYSNITVAGFPIKESINHINRVSKSYLIIPSCFPTKEEINLLNEIILNLLLITNNIELRIHPSQWSNNDLKKEPL